MTRNATAEPIATTNKYDGSVLRASLFLPNLSAPTPPIQPFGLDPPAVLLVDGFDIPLPAFFQRSR